MVYSVGNIRGKIEMVSTEKPTLRIHSKNTYDVAPNQWLAGLHAHFKIIIDDIHPNIIILPWDSNKWLAYDCIKIFNATEHFFPICLFADIIISNRHTDDIYYHSEMPWNEGLEKFLNNQHPNFLQDKNAPKKYFCNFIFSNKNAHTRNVFLHKMLAKFGGEKIHCWGQYKNNIRTLYTGDTKITQNDGSPDIMAHYKFSICFENSDWHGSFSEKVPNALRARSVPIYWGGEDIYKFVKPHAFIDAKDFNTLDDLVKYIDKVNTDDALYKSYILDDPFINDTFVQAHFQDAFCQNVAEIIKTIPHKKIRWKQGTIAKILFYILFRIYRKFWRLTSLKRRFIGGK